MEERYIQDEEIEELIVWVPGFDVGRITQNKLTALLQELLTLRKKVRNDASI